LRPPLHAVRTAFVVRGCSIRPDMVCPYWRVAASQMLVGNDAKIQLKYYPNDNSACYIAF
jgi:hypothetical protein